MRSINQLFPKALLSLFVALSLISFSACDEEDNNDDIDNTPKCVNGAKQCRNGKLAICHNDNWVSSNNDCEKEDSSGGGKPGEGNNSGTGESSNKGTCEMIDAGQSCSACTPVCSADGGTAYLCNSKTGKSMKWSCANNDCAVNGTKVTCTKP